MAIYSLAQRGITGTAAAAQWEIRTTSTDRPRIYEIGVSVTAATASIFGIGRPAAIGISPTSPQTVLAEDSGDPVGTVTAAVAWGTPPTVPVNFFRRFGIPAAIGNQIILTFPRGLVIPVSSSIVVWNIGTNAVSDLWAVIEE